MLEDLIRPGEEITFRLSRRNGLITYTTVVFNEGVIKTSNSLLWWLNSVPNSGPTIENSLGEPDKDLVSVCVVERIQKDVA